MSADTTPAALATRAAEELAQGGYEIAKATALVAIAGALAAIADQQLDERCDCTHLRRYHLADLSECVECIRYEPPSHHCDGFTPDRSAR